MKRNRSIIVNDLKRCYVCNTTADIHIHEVFYGTANRQKSIKWGLYVGLCAKHHNMSGYGVHFNKDLDKKLKQTAQKKFEELYGHEKFMQEFHKNYL